jgi:hypothetical protein
MALCNLGFITDQYGWKSKVFNKFQQKSPILSFNNICETVYEIIRNRFKAFYVNQALLQTN